MMNPLKAVLSADLPIDIDDAIEWFPDQGRSQWAEDIAEGIRTAEMISRRHMDQLLASKKVMRWVRAVEALARRHELTIQDANAILKLAGGELQVVENLNMNTGITSNSRSDPKLLEWGDRLERLLEKLRQERKKDYDH